MVHKSFTSQHVHARAKSYGEAKSNDFSNEIGENNRSIRLFIFLNFIVFVISWYHVCYIMVSCMKYHGIVHVHVISWYRAFNIMISCMLYHGIVHVIYLYRACNITIVCIAFYSKANTSLILFLFIFYISDYFWANLLSTLSDIVVSDIFTSILPLYQLIHLQNLI